MANSESFLEEVAEELRRERLFRFLKKYGWLLALVIIASVLSVVVLEWSKKVEYARAIHNGDLLFDAIKEADDGNLANLRELTLGSSSFLSPKDDLIALSKLFLAEYLYKLEENPDEAFFLLEEVSTEKSVSIELNQLASLKYLLVYNQTDGKRDQLISELAAPNNYYKFLALEQRIYGFLKNNQIDEASRQIEILLNEPEVSQAQKTRLMDFKLAIQ